MEPARDAASEGSTRSLAEYLRVLSSEKRLHVLRYLVHPHYLEEIASELGLSRQSARSHVKQLLDIGVIRAIEGRRATGPVTDYIVAPERMFALQESLADFARITPDQVGSDELRAVTDAMDDPVGAEPSCPGPKLVTVHGARPGFSTVLAGPGPWLIGREPDATLCIEHDPFVSTRHAEMARTSGGYTLSDLYSSNGTFHEWSRIERGGTVPVRHGDVLQVGRTIVVFKEPQGTDASGPTDAQ